MQMKTFQQIWISKDKYDENDPLVGIQSFSSGLAAPVQMSPVGLGWRPWLQDVA